MSEKKIKIFLSGGLSNTDVNLSLGGVMSTTELFGNVPVFDLGTILTGVTLTDTLGGAETGSIGAIFFDFATTELSFKKEGGLPAVNLNDFTDVSTDGNYILTCTEGDVSVSVSVVSASLPGSSGDDDVFRTKINPNLFENILEAEAITGSDKYRHFYLYNDTASQIQAATYILSNFNGLDVLALGFENVISGSEDKVLADEDTAPLEIDVTFALPINKTEADTLTINSGEAVGMYVRRTVPILADVTTIASTSSLVMEII